MKRSSFLRSLAGVPALGLLSVHSFKQYEKVYLKNVYVRGFSYYDGPKIIDQINQSGSIEMIREPKNEFDKRAIALYFNHHKIGYLPQESNKTLSILIDTEMMAFHAEISEINHSSTDWEKIRVAIYALKEIHNSEDLKKIEPYAALQTSGFFSLRSEDNTITRVIVDEKVKHHEPEPKIERVEVNFG